MKLQSGSPSLMTQVFLDLQTVPEPVQMEGASVSSFHVPSSWAWLGHPALWQSPLSFLQKPDLLIHCIFCSSNKIISRQTNRCDSKKYTHKGMFSQCLMKGKEAGPLAPRGAPSNTELSGSFKVPLALCCPQGPGLHCGPSIRVPLTLAKLLPGSAPAGLTACHTAQPSRIFHISLPLHMLIPWPAMPFLPFFYPEEWTCHLF